MPSNPDISVIIPVYNPGPHFDECAESVLSQAGCSIEAIFVDDGSAAMLDELAQGDSRIRVFHQENQGAGPARNLGIEHATGEYIAFMDSDDYYPTDHALSDLLTTARDKGTAICGGSMVLLNQETGTFIDAFADDELYVFDHEGWRNYADDQMDYGYTRYIYRKDLFEDAALRFPARRWYEDPLFFVPAMYKAQGRTPTCLLYVRALRGRLRVDSSVCHRQLGPGPILVLVSPCSHVHQRAPELQRLSIPTSCRAREDWGQLRLYQAR